MIDPKPGDYVMFTRRIVPATKARVRASDGTNCDFETTPEMLVDWTAHGLVKRVAKGVKKISGQEVRTMRVDVGKYDGGVITAVLDATCRFVGVQETLFGPDVKRGPAMYSSDAAGLA